MSADPSQQLAPPPWRVALPRIALRLLVIGCAVVAIKLGFDWLMAKIALLESDAAARAMTRLIVIALIGYAVLIAVPFVPGIEIGLALLVIEGAAAAPYVYLATVAGLFAAFLIGQTLSLDWLHRVFADLHMMRACSLLDRIKKNPREDRLADLTDRLPKWIAKPLIDYRYLTIALLINLPGNSVIGGGGGIMLLAGISRLFHSVWMGLTIAVITLPVPLAVWLWGTEVLG